MHELTLEQKIGQMLLVGFRGVEVSATDSIHADIAAGRVGGVILFDFDLESKTRGRNIRSSEQLKQLVQTLVAVAPLPLFVSIDQEGGRVQRLNAHAGFPAFLSHQAIGSSTDPEGAATATGDAIGKLLREHGINLNFAPCLDVNVNLENPVIGRYERSFSSDAELVSRLAAKFMQAQQRHGVLAAVKHFPGHGSSQSDSHKGFVDLSATWSERELVPFAEMIQAGLPDMVMSAHVFNRFLDRVFPATLSQQIVDKLLRRKLNYTGVVVSDDMQMGAITQNYSLEIALERAINAGIDLLVFGNNLEFDPIIAQNLQSIIQRLVKEGLVPLSRIEESCSRILRLKQKLRSP